MADKTVIVEVQYDTSQAIKNIENYTSAIEGAKVEQAGLKAELEAGKISQKDYAIAIEQSKNNQNKANAERKATIQLLGSEKGSIDELKARIKQLTLERNGLNRTTVDGRTKAKLYNDQIIEMQKALKGAQTESAKSRGAFAAFGNSLMNLPGPLGGIIQGIVGMTKAAIAFIATPIGAIITAIVLAFKALMAYLKGSEDGQNKLNKILNVGKAIFEALMDVVENVGKVIFDAISKPKELIKDLGKLIKENLINRFQAFGVMGKAIVKIFKGDFKQGFKELAEGGIQAATGVTHAFDKIKNAVNGVKSALNEMGENIKKKMEQAKQMSDLQASIDKRERKLIVERERVRLESDELILKSKRKDLHSEEERLVMLTKASKLINDLADAESALAVKRLQAAKLRLSIEGDTKEMLDEVANAEAAVIAKKAEGLEARRRIEGQISELTLKTEKETVEKVAEVDKKAEEDTLKRRGEAIWKLAELKNQELENEAKTIQAKRDAQIKAAEDEKARALETQELLNEEKELIEAEHKARLVEIETDYQEQIRAQRQQALDEALAGMQQIIAASQEMSDARVNIGLDAFSKLTTINWDEVKTSKDAFLAIGQAAQGLTSLITAGHEKETANLQAQKAKELAAVEGNKEATDAVNKKFAKKEQQLKKKQFENDKKKALIDTAIATALAVVKGLASGLPMPGLLMAALAAVAGGISLATIASQQYTPTESFSKGGIIGGLPHSQGGTSFVGSDGSRFEAEKGEAMFVLKKDATAEIAALSAINESFGGRSFTKGASHLQEGGQAVPIGIERSIDEAIQRTPIFVRVGDIETGLTETQNVKQAGVI